MNVALSNPWLLPLVPAALLAGWLLVALARSLRDLKAFDGFEGMHLEPEDLDPERN